MVTNDIMVTTSEDGYSSDESTILEDDLINHLLMSDSDDEDNNAATNQRKLLVNTSFLLYKQVRDSYYVRDRLIWLDHTSQLTKEGPKAFSQMYRMSLNSFNKLCIMLKDFLQVDVDMSNRRTNKLEISNEIILSSYLRWIGGGSYHDIRITAGISISSFYQCIIKCTNAINDCNQLAYYFPKTNQQLMKASDAFNNISSNNAIIGCVGCIDGYLLRVKVPSVSQVGNVKSYFSGHYQTYGINIQAVCDHRCRFLEVAVCAPGGSNDVRAYKKCSLWNSIQNLPIGKFVIGDNAYGCSENLLTPFAGSQKDVPKNNAYNFYVSQLRIRIEMAFGLLVTKWRVLKSPIQVPIGRIGNLFLSITRMHNYCINESNFNEHNNSLCELEKSLFIPSDNTTTYLVGNSLMREIIVENLQEQGLHRPEYNLNRNKGNN
jgi:hypothetical protein